MADQSDLVTPAEVVVRLIETPHGPARARVVPAHPHQYRRQGAGTVLLSHGAGGQSDSADLAALAAALPQHGWTVALVDQPWRVAGRRVASPPVRLDQAYLPVASDLLAGAEGLPRPFVSAGRSAGARVVCRTAAELRPDAVLAVSFPLHPPRRPESSRYAELAAATSLGLPVRVIQGSTDPFGTPAELLAAGLDPRALMAVRGSHTPHPGDVVDATLRMLAEVFA